jgi:zinc/manganese transport system permease protein
MNIDLYLDQAFAQHALLAGGLVAIACGLIGPFVVSRGMAFAVHGTSELAFTGAGAGLLLFGNPVLGAFIGSLIVATVFGTLGTRARERDSSIGVILAFGLGLGVLFLSFYHGFATQATNILFGNIFGVSTDQLTALITVAIGVLVAMTVIYRPLLFASVDPDVAEAKGVPVRMLGIIFLFILALTVTSAAQVVGTLLVLSLAITPAAAAQRIATKPFTITLLSVLFACIASIGGILASLMSGTVKPSIFVTAISFTIYVFTLLVGTSRTGSKRSSLHH